MPRETMTPRERWLAVLKREKPDRIPMDYWGTDETTAKLLKHFGTSSVKEMLQKMHVDYVFSVSPKYVGPQLPANTDVFGIQYKNIDYGSGVYAEAVTHPLAQYQSIDEIEKNYHWPQPDWWDYRDIPQQIKDHDNYPIRGGGSEPFLTYKDLRGDEQALMDLSLNPEIVEFCLNKLFELAYENTLRILETVPGKVNLSYVAEDMGGQTNLMFSPAHIRKFLFPGMKRMIDLAHQAGVFVFHHNDGNIIRILPELVDMGIDILNPIQWRASGMDRKMLKEQYGSRLIFHGAMDNQHTLPFGSAEEVRQEVYENIKILGDNGGYILAPCHNIQPVTPIENILAMYETAYEAGWI